MADQAGTHQGLTCLMYLHSIVTCRLLLSTIMRHRHKPVMLLTESMARDIKTVTINIELLLCFPLRQHAVSSSNSIS